MVEGDELEEMLHKQQAVRQLLPNAWSAFYARFGALRPIQLDAAPPILSGSNVLVTAPTAGGKTEAVVAPLCERIKSGRWPGLSVLLITPTRALVNDLFMRLERPCQYMDVRLGRKTADHGMSDGIADQLLITTPESTESLLTFRRHVLDDVQAIAIDEIHLLDGSPRGDQLRSLLSRISAYLHYKSKATFRGLQVIALSATVSDPKRLADAYLGAAAKIVASPGQRRIESHVILADGCDEMGAKAAVDAFGLFEDVHKVLVFVNSRKQVDAGTSFFQYGPFAGFPVFGHHGSLSKQHRETTEARFKNEPRAICVATMTLEVGIDIGDIDLVVCLDPPFSLSSFLQRIGRGCRRLAGLTRVLCVARDRAGEILFHSMIRQAGLGLPIGPLKPFRTSVLVQQVLAYLKQVDSNCRTIDQFQRVLCHDRVPRADPERINLLLQDMVRQELLDVRGKVYQPAKLGWEFIESSRIYANIAPAPYEVALVDADTGATIANVAAVFGASVRVAGRSYEIVSGGSPGQRKVRATTAAASSPRYHTGGLPYSADIGASVAGYFGIDSNTLAVMEVAGGIVVMTWLGKLLNEAIGNALQQARCVVKVGAFSVVLQSQTSADALRLITNAAKTVVETNPLGQLKVENLADMGPYFSELSDGLKEVVRADWLDQSFLSKWADGLSKPQLIDSESSVGRDLLALS